MLSCVHACVHVCSRVVGVIAHVKPDVHLRCHSWECHPLPLETRSLMGLQLTDHYTGWRILISPTPHPLPPHPHPSAGITNSCDHAWQFSLVEGTELRSSQSQGKHSLQPCFLNLSFEKVCWPHTLVFYLFVSSELRGKRTCN